MSKRALLLIRLIFFARPEIIEDGQISLSTEIFSHLDDVGSIVRR